MKINYALISRVLIALLFVVAGFGKLTHFDQTVAGFGMMNLPMPTIAVLIAIAVELPVALMFAAGYKTFINGVVLAVFTVAATLIAHTNWADQMTMIMALKNIAIIGGIMAAVKCTCGCDDCKTCKVKK